ncbi:MAG: DUF3592 domain-containing protein [Bryobacteraceae bacterium]
MIRLGVLVLVFGLAFLIPAAWIGYESYRIVSAWPSTVAVSAGSEIVSFEQQQRRHAYRVHFELRYAIDGRTYSTPGHSRLIATEYDVIRVVAETYSAGTIHPIRYDPSDPHEIRVAPDGPSLWTLPIALGLIGGVLTPLGVWMVARGQRRQSHSCPACGTEVDDDYLICPGCATRLTPASGSDEEEELPAEYVTESGKGIEIIAGIVFALVSLALLSSAAAVGYSRYEVWAEWQATAGEAVAVDIGRHTGSRGELQYRPEIGFRYVAAGRERLGSALSEITLGYASARRIVEDFQPGTRHPIRYNPKRPEEIRCGASLRPEYFGAPFALGLVAVGLGLLSAYLLRPAASCRRTRCLACARVVPRNGRFCPYCSAPA